MAITTGKLYVERTPSVWTPHERETAVVKQGSRHAPLTHAGSVARSLHNL